MRPLRMTTRRWMVAVATVAVLAWGFHRDGFGAMYWEVPLLGSSLGILVASEKRRHLAGSVLGGVVVNACFWFVNFFYRDYTFHTMLVMPEGPFSEAMGGAVAGAVVGLLMAGVTSLPSAVARFTVRDWTIAVAISALVLTGLICFIRSPFQERVVMVAVAIFVGLSYLVVTGAMRLHAGCQIAQKK